MMVSRCTTLAVLVVALSGAVFANPACIGSSCDAHDSQVLLQSKVAVASLAQQTAYPLTGVSQDMEGFYAPRHETAAQGLAVFHAILVILLGVVILVILLAVAILVCSSWSSSKEAIVSGDGCLDSTLDGNPGDPSAHAGKTIIAFIFISTCVRCIDYSVIITTVYDLVKPIGGSGAFSGLVIGAYYAAAVIGVFLYNLLVAGLSVRSLTLGGHLCLVVSTSIYFISPLLPHAIMVFSLVVSRCLCGALDAMLHVAQASMLARISSPDSRVHTFLMLELCQCMSYAAGPLICSVCLRAAPSLPSINSGVLGTGFVCVLHLLVFILAALLFPSEVDTANAEHAIEACDHREKHDHTGPVSDIGELTTTQKYPVMLLVVSILLLQMMICGVEVGSALQLELRYKWLPGEIGNALGLCFAGFVPLYLLYQCLPAHFSCPKLVRLGSLIVLAATWFWHPQVCLAIGKLSGLWPGECAACVIISDAVMYPMISFLIGIVKGTAYNLVAVQDRDWFGSWYKVVSSVAYSMVPSLARYLVETVGAMGYCCAQVSLGILLIVVTEVAMPQAKSCELSKPTQKSVA